MPRTAVISDIHANLHALSAVIQDVQLEQCTDVVCLGDVVGYNAYPRECLDYIRSLNCPVVKGNHDEEVCRADYTRMNPMARQAMEWTRAQLDEDQLTWLARLQYQRIVRSQFTMVHSCLDQPKAWNYIMNAHDASANFRKQFSPLCFHGHTHVPKVYVWDGAHCTEDAEALLPLYGEGYAEVPLPPAGTQKFFVNPGSVGQPRDMDNRACYAIYDSDARVIIFKRVPYDIEGAQQAILAAGLPTMLADRLAAGR